MKKKSNHFSFYEHFVARLGGINIEVLEKLRSKELKVAFAVLNELVIQLELLKKNLLDNFFGKISQETDRKQRNIYLELRRSINRLKPFSINQNEIDNLSKYSEHSSEISNLLILSAELLLKKKEYKQVYLNAEKQSRHAFKTAVKNEDFLNGLLLSSDSLYDNLKIYEKSNDDILPKKIQQLERGLLKYFTRMAAKSTPFSTFCSIIPGNFISNTNGSTNVYSIISDPSKKTTEVTLNKDLLNLILEFLYNDLNIRRSIPVELNPTIVKTEENYRFLTTINGREVFQKLNQNPALDLLFNRLSEENNALSFGQLIQLVLQLDELETNEEEVNSYLSKLIEIGLIRFCIGIPNQDAYWHLILVKFLAGIVDQKSQSLAVLLKVLDDNLKLYRTLSVPGRKNLLKITNQQINDSFKEVGILGKRRNNLPVYEDASSDSSVIITRKSFEEIEYILQKFVEITFRCAYPRGEQASMRAFFDSFYKDQESVPLLQFYEDYYREHYKEHQEKTRKVQAGKKEEGFNPGNPFNLEHIKKIYESNNFLSKFIYERWKENIDSDEINISLNEIENIYSKDVSINKENLSVSIFAQPVYNHNDHCINLVIPGGKYMLGFGKYFSRFLYLFEKTYQQSVMDNNDNFGNIILAEISHDANFNANLHPQLVDSEIVYPTGEGGYSTNKISCSELMITRSTERKFSLDLIHSKSGKRIVPLDLGFLNPMMRPPLFQLLSKLSPPSGFSLPIPESLHMFEKKTDSNNGEGKDNQEKQSGTQVEKPKEDVRFRPRIVLENKIILSRKTWNAHSMIVPMQEEQELNEEYFIRINSWRVLNKIPDQVYVRVKPLPANKVAVPEKKEDENNKAVDEKIVHKEELAVNQVENNPEKIEKVKTEETIADQKKENPKEVQRYSKDFYKPQFIDFYNPLLVNLFGKISGNLENFIVIFEERLPGYEELVEYDDKRFANELVLQLDIKQARHVEHSFTGVEEYAVK